MTARYNIYFAGQLLEGHLPEAVRASIAKLFNADQPTLDKLFSGKPQLVKRECDKATALKYKQAFERAGALPIIRAADPAPPNRESAPRAAGTAMTAAERIAALANAPDPSGDQPPASQAEAVQPDPVPGDLDLAPAGTDVLLPEERAQEVVRAVDTSALELAGSGQRLSAVPPTPPQAPDTSHLSTAAVGETLPTLPSEAIALNPDTSSIDLSPEGSDFSDCATTAIEAPLLDLAGINLAPAGSEVLEQQYRKRPTEQAPATDHLSLED
jgi:hypothetical protein